MFENLKNIFDAIDNYFSDLSNKEEKFNKTEERESIIKNKSWLNICQKSKLNNIHITAKQKNNIAF